MKKKKFIAIKSIKDSIKLIKKNIIHLPIPIILDLGFIIIFGSLLSVMNRLVQDHIQFVMEFVSTNPHDFTQKVAFSGSLIGALREYPATNASVNSVIMLLGLTVILGYVIWCLFQIFSYRWVYKFVKVKVKLLQFVRQFMLSSVIWTLLIAIIFLVQMKFVLYNAVQIDEFISIGALRAIGYVLLLIVFYFALISLSLLGKKKMIRNTFKIGVMKAYNTIPAYVFVLVAFVILELILRLFSKIHPTVTLIGGIILVIPMFTFIKIYFNKIVSEVK